MFESFGKRKSLPDSLLKIEQQFDYEKNQPIIWKCEFENGIYLTGTGSESLHSM